jgi:hypothetical protein
VLWQQRKKSIDGLASATKDGFKRQTMPQSWIINSAGLMLPGRGAA